MGAVEASPNEELGRVFRHPKQSKNYFAEYASLVRANNLHFSPALSYDRFFLRPDHVDEELRVYIDGLLKAASTAQRTAVLCFCRSQMRSAWMKKVFGGAHIVQIRNPADQWASFHVERYFRNKMLIIALKLRQLYPAAFEHIEGFERFARYMAKHPALAVERLFDSFITEKDALAVFLVIWMASVLQAISYADFILDIDRLSTDLDSRNVAAKCFQAIGCPIDFSDCVSPSSAESSLPSNEFERMLGDAATAIQTNAAPLVIVDDDVIMKRLPLLSRLSGRVLRMALEQ